MYHESAVVEVNRIFSHFVWKSPFQIVVIPPKKEKRHPEWDTVQNTRVFAVRRYPHPTPDEQARRSSGGVCEPDFHALCAEKPDSNRGDTAKGKKNGIPNGIPFSLEVAPGFEPGIMVLQTSALPLGYATAFTML